MPGQTSQFNPEDQPARYVQIADLENGEPTGRIRDVRVGLHDDAIGEAQLNAPFGDDGVRKRQIFKNVELPSPEAIALIIARLDNDTAAQAALRIVEDS